MSAAALFPPGSVLGMVHVSPLPGSPRWGGSMASVLDRAVADGRALVEGGVSGLIVENYGDVPFHPGRVPIETVAAMALVVGAVVGAVGAPVGVNVLRNDGQSAIAIAAAAGARFIRVNVHTGVMFTDQGLLQGTAHRTLRLRAKLGVEVAVFADVFVKHGSPPAGATLEAAARDTAERGLADALVVSGPSTGAATDVEHVERVRAAVPALPVWVGSGATTETAPKLLEHAYGLIVGSAFERGGIAGNRVDPERVRRFMTACRRDAG